MSSLGGTGIVLWDGNPVSGDPASIHGYSAALEASIKYRIVASFPTLLARDNAYSSLTLINRRGIKCWVDEIAGFCHHDGRGWRYGTDHHLIYGATRPAAADAAANTTVDILLGPAVVLPTGNRRLLIQASTLATCLTVANSAIGIYPAGIVSGPGIGGNEGLMKCGALMTVGATGKCVETWPVVTSGSVTYNLRGTDDTPAAKSNVRFSDSRISVMDMGPADDLP